MLYIYFLLYIVYLIIYRETVNRWAVCPHRLACLLVLVGDRFRRWAVCSSSMGGSWCWLVIVQTVGGVFLVGWSASWCWCVIGSGGGRFLVLVGDRFMRWAVCSSSMGVPPGVGV